MSNVPRVKKKSGKIIKYPPNTMPPEKVLAGYREQQTWRGRKETYTPINPTLFPAEYKKPYFTLKDINSLAKLVLIFHQARSSFKSATGSKT